MITLNKSVTLDRVIAMVERDDSEGICANCGCDAIGVEPDARAYACEECGLPTVYGAEELLFMVGDNGSETQAQRDIDGAWQDNLGESPDY